MGFCLSDSRFTDRPGELTRNTTAQARSPISEDARIGKIYQHEESVIVRRLRPKRVIGSELRGSPGSSILLRHILLPLFRRREKQNSHRWSVGGENTKIPNHSKVRVCQ